MYYLQISNNKYMFVSTTDIWSKATKHYKISTWQKLFSKVSKGPMKKIIIEASS